MTAPLVSILLPVYNGEKFVAATIRSLLDQDYPNFELLVCDDASVDRSAEIVQSFKDPRLRFWHNETNQGISPTRNFLMREAKGKYLAVSDHDDISLPRRLSEEVAFLEKNPQITAVGCWGELFCREAYDGRFGRMMQLITNLGWVWCQPPFPDLREALRGCPVMHSSSLLRKADLERCGISYHAEMTPCEDYDLFCRILEHGLKLANLQQVLFRYHRHGGNFSIRDSKRGKANVLKIKDRLKGRLGIKKPGYYPYFLVMLQKLRLKPFVKGTRHV